MKPMPFILLLASVLVAQLGRTAWAADAEEGKQIFDRRCRVCHSIESGVNKIGPSLAGVVGRKAGSAAGYHYSKAVKDSNVVWTEQNLEQWLTSPRKFIPGDKMAFPGLRKPDERQDVIAYLKEESE